MTGNSGLVYWDHYNIAAFQGHRMFQLDPETYARIPLWSFLSGSDDVKNICFDMLYEETL